MNKSGPGPKLDITDEWRERVMAAMEAQGVSQEQLAARVGATQNAISMIVRGRQASSKYVSQICKVLRLPLPQRHADDLARQWTEVGEALRSDNPEAFESVLKLVENMAKALEKKS